MDSKNHTPRVALKRRLLAALTFAAGSLVLASTAAPAGATKAPPAPAPVIERVDAARTALRRAIPTDQRALEPVLELAWWRNWGNGGWHPWWHNWPNWHNWGNMGSGCNLPE